MINTLLGIKKGMTSTYDSRGRRVGATILEITPNWVTQTKAVDGNDGYNSVQIGMGQKKNVAKPQQGHLKKAKVETSLRFLREIRVSEVDVEPGTEIKLNQVFSKGDSVKITGVSKGKGFQGGVKRHGFHGGPKTHGQSDRHRAPGSIGSGTTPGRVYKGKNMAGHMGMDQVSIVGVEVVALNKKDNLLVVKGGVPGPIGTLIRIEKQGRIKGYTPPPEEKEDDEEETKENDARDVAADSAMEAEATPEASVDAPAVAETAPVVAESAEPALDQVVDAPAEEVKTEEVAAEPVAEEEQNG